ncbi:cobalt-precorrin 5A hydrolase [Geomesophilobacter sediminis]|uniref:Cobalt-precorrin 5A hydrolase n=1 Tax=Geomesophilobacter sediminis TaxID=2798584 RepID=A0A8J7LYT4_9BACT|nr:cobalt-precorrin 5A hydrolase [Geomesophilobacter sediminis]MBJ6725422.1 cobalt-precorrin 5A hydrolase [Geomesophilobacter sediminis]
MRVAIIAITRNGARLGQVLLEGFPKGELFVTERFATGKAAAFSGGVRELVERLWLEYEGFVFIMATGIVVRTVAPLLRSKDTDPAVVAIDDAGRFAISLLSGHLGGANALARSCAALTGSVPVVTTATDANDLPSFDMLAKEHHWEIDDLGQVKYLNALLLEGEPIAVVDPSGAVQRYFGGRGEVIFHDRVDDALAAGAAGYVFVTDAVVPAERAGERILVLRPRRKFLGIGCNKGTSAAEIEAVVRENLEQLGISLRGVRCVATAAAKRSEPGLVEFAALARLPLVSFESAELNEVEIPSPPSEHALAAIGAKGVAEPAALLASCGGRIILRKVKSGNVTLAVAEALSNKDAQD